MLAALDQGYADPRRLHGPARNARLILDNAREAVAEALGVRRDEVSFTSSGTDAVHRGLLGLVRASRRGRVVVHSAGRALRGAPRPGLAAPTSDPVGVTGGRAGHDGRPRRARSAAPDVAAVALQSANHEVGTIQPVGEVELPDGVPLFMDACASMGRLPLPDGWSVAAGSAHKWGGPAGVGVLLVRKGARWRSPFPEDDRVDERVAGFENVPAALGAAAALQAVVAERDEVNARQHALVDRIRARVGGDPGHRGGRRPGGPAPPPGDLLVPLRRRRGDRGRAQPARLPGRQRLGLHRLHPRAQPRAGRDGRAHPRQRAGLADPGRDRGGRRRVPRRAARASWPTSAGTPGL